MLQLARLHHIAIIVSDYEKSKKFYTEILGLQIIQEIYRTDRDSYKLDLSLQGCFVIELFSFANPPLRPSQPEARGLRHVAFEVIDLDASVASLHAQGVETEAIRIDVHTDKRFVFLADPDGLPIELYER